MGDSITYRHNREDKYENYHGKNHLIVTGNIDQPLAKVL
jgi:hypothetical protein